MKDIYIGQFDNNGSFIQKLDARLKMYFLIIYSLLCLFSAKMPQIGLCAVTGVVWFMLSGFEFIKIWRNIKKVVVMIIFLSLFNVLFSHNVIYALVFFARLILIAEMAAIFVISTRPRDILYGIEKGFHIKNEYAMSIAIAFSFLPMLNKEMNQIRIAQAARGADISSGSLKQRVRNSISVIIPLFSITLNKSEILAEAMDIRCYDSGEKRTAVRELKYGKKDMVVGIYTIFLIAGVYLVGVLL